MMTQEEFVKSLPKEITDDFKLIKDGKLSMYESAKKNGYLYKDDYGKFRIKASYLYAYTDWFYYKSNEDFFTGK